MDLIKVAEQAFAAENPVEHPSFNTGDTVSVHYKIVEGNKERIQVFRGVVIQVKGTGSTKTFTVRKMSGNVGVERIFPIESPFIKEIEVNKVGKVRRARIYYFRNLTGKKAKIIEHRMVMYIDPTGQFEIKKALRCRAFFISYLCQIFKEYFIVSTKTESSQQ